MEQTMFFGLITAPAENAFLIGWCIGMGTFALLTLVANFIDKHSECCNKYI